MNFNQNIVMYLIFYLIFQDLTIFLWSNAKLLESVWVEFLHILLHQLLNMLFLQSWLWPKTSKNLTNWPKQPISQLEGSNACYLRTKVKLTTYFHEFSEYESTIFFSTKYYWTYALVFSNYQNWEKNNCFEQQGFFSFSTEKYWWKIRRFVWWKFVKTCRELNNSCGYYWNRSDWQEMCPKDFWTCLQSLMLWCLPSKWLDKNHSQRWICPTWTTFSRGNKFNNNF